MLSGMSKSGLFAHFGSKQELQLATMERGERDLHRARARARAARPHRDRAVAPARGELSALRRGRDFPGGCFFASVAAEVDTHPGPVRDVAVQVMHDWLALLEQTIREAQAEGAVDTEVDPAQLAFEIEASLYYANTLFVITGGPAPIERARRSLQRRFAEVATISALKRAVSSRCGSSSVWCPRGSARRPHACRTVAEEQAQARLGRRMTRR